MASARAELGYDYCTEADCQARCMKRIEIAAVGVNKAADQFVRAVEVRPPAPRGTYSFDDETGSDESRSRPRRAPRKQRRETTLDRLRGAAAVLDAALSRSYDRFCRDEITARELKTEQRKLLRGYNELVRAENIRYRSMLRPEPPV